MKQIRHKWFWLSGVAGLLVTGTWWLWPGGGTEGANELTGKLLGHRSSLRRQVKEAREHPAELLALVPELAERGMTEENECFACYPASFTRFAPEDFRTLFATWPHHPSRQWLLAHTGAYLLTVKDGARVRAVMEALPEGTARNGVFHKLAKESDLFLPPQIAPLVQGWGNDELDAIGRGLALRIKPMTHDAQAPLVVEYFVKLEAPTLTSALAATHVATWAKSDARASVAWLLSQPAARVEGGDEDALKELVKKEAPRAVEFVQALWSRGEAARAERDVACLAELYAKADAAAALNWSIGLPREIKARAQAVGVCYARLMMSDPPQAAVLLAATRDAELSEIYRKERERRK